MLKIMKYWTLYLTSFVVMSTFMINSGGGIFFEFLCHRLHQWT